MNMEMPFIPAGLKPSYRETCTSLDQERNLEDMQTLDCGFEPSGLLLWGKSANCCITVLPSMGMHDVFSFIHLIIY